MKQRIALVAVSALTAGVLSVVSTPAANAGAGDITTITGTGTGLISSSTTGLSTTMTAVVLQTGTLIVTTNDAAGYYVVSAGGYITGNSVGSGAISNDQQKFDPSGSTDAFIVGVRPTAAAGSTFTITGYTTPTSGVEVDVITVTVAASSLSGTVSTANSGAFWHTSAAEVLADTAGASAVAPVTQMYLDIDPLDAYKAAVTTAGALVATATAGANVSLVAVGATTAGAFSTAVLGTDPSLAFVVVSEATRGAGWKGSVTVTYNGTVIATKSGSIAGYASKLNITRDLVASYGTTTAAAVRFTTTDSAGNSVAVTAADVQLDTSSDKTVVTGIVGVDAQVITAGSLADGKATVSCSSPGSSSVVMKYVTPAGVTIKSNALTVICGSTKDTYTASWDKASYKQGDLAKLTVTFKDIFGAPANSQSAVTTYSSASDELISTPMMTRIGSTTAALSPDENGQLVFTYSVGTTTGVTPGAYQASVSFPTVNAVNGKAQAVAYTIASDGSVTNADVLKSIVSLIASINKQIQALQKLILARR
jgi:hypothetical protein